MRTLTMRAARIGSLCLALFSASCAEFHVQIPVTNDPNASNGTPATPLSEKHTTFSFFWGLITDSGVQVQNCTECGMQDIKISRDVFEQILSIVTLGIVSPMDIQWRCQAAKPREGDISRLIGKDQVLKVVKTERNQEGVVYGQP